LASFAKALQSMLGKSQTRLTRGLLLVVYFLATTTAAWFHDHSLPCDHDHAIGHTAGGVCLGHGAGVDGDHLATTGDCHEEEALRGAPLLCPNDATNDGCPSSDDDCAVCRFLGLCSLPVPVLALPASHDLLVAANPAEPIHESRPLDRTLHSRAPPRLV